MSGPRTRWQLPQGGPGQYLPGSIRRFQPDFQTTFERAVKFNGVDASGLERTSSLPGPSNWSIGLFFHIATAPAAAHDYAIWMLQDTTSGSTPTNYQDIEIDNTRAVNISSPAGDTVLFTAALNVWYFLGVSIGSGACDCYFGAARNSGGPLTHTNIAAFTTAFTGADLTLATDNFTGGGGDFPDNGRLSGVKVYNGAQLSAGDWYSESLQIPPFRTSNIYAAWPLTSSATKLTDTSGTGNNLTARGAGTWTDEEGPFIPFTAVTPAGPQTASVTGIAEVTAVGTPTGKAVAVAQPTGIAEVTAVGTPTGKFNSRAQVTGIAEVVALGTPTLVPGAVVAHPTGIAEATAVGTPTGKTAITATHAGAIAEVTAVGTPTARTVAVAHPTGIAQAVALGTPTLIPGAVTAHVTGIAQATAVGTPTAKQNQKALVTGISQSVALGTPTGKTSTTAHPTGIAEVTAVGTPTGKFNSRATPTGIAQATAAGTPTLRPGAAVAHPTGISQPVAVGTPAASHTSPGQRTLVGVGVSQATAVGTPTLVPGRATLHGVGISQSTAAGTPTGRTAITAHPTGISQATHAGTPASSTHATARPVGIAQPVAVGTPTLVGGHQTAIVVGIAQVVAVGTPTAIQARDQTEQLSGTLIARDALVGVMPATTEQLQGVVIAVDAVAGLMPAAEQLAGVAVQSDALIGIADPSK